MTRAGFAHGRRRFLLGSAAAAATLSLAPYALAAVELAVIVHRENMQRLSLDEIEAIFRTTLRYWATGKPITAFNLVPGSAERVSFDRATLRLEPDGVTRYWIDRKIRGGQPPPRHVPNPALVLRLIEELRTGIGYVPASLVEPAVRVVARVRGTALVVAGQWSNLAEEA